MRLYAGDLLVKSQNNQHKITLVILYAIVRWQHHVEGPRWTSSHLFGQS